MGGIPCMGIGKAFGALLGVVVLMVLAWMFNASGTVKGILSFATTFIFIIAIASLFMCAKGERYLLKW
jgi:hypothetical protein